MHSRKKILLLAPSLRGGGAERIMCQLARHLGRKQFEVHLALVKKEGPYLKDIPKDIILHDLRAGRVRRAFWPLWKLIWNLRPYAVLSTLGHLNIALVMLRPFLPMGIRIVIRESNTVSEVLKELHSPVCWKLLYRRFYPTACRIICQSVYMQKDLEEHFHVPPRLISQIYNPVDMEHVQARAQEGENPFSDYQDGLNLVGIGRLEKQKGFRRLIEMMPSVLEKHPNAHLWILGEGRRRKELEKTAEKLNIKDHVHLPGFQDNPWVWLKHADLFVLSSEHEGLPNVLLEAITLKCPVAAVKNPGGTEEILKMCHLKERYVEKLEWDDAWLDRSKCEKAYHALEKHFGLQPIIKQYSKVLESC